MSDRDRRVIFALILAGPLCGFLLGSSGVPAPLPAVAGGLLVLVLPGYAIQRALFASERLDTPARLTMTLGLSLTLCILGGFLLNASPTGFSAPGWGLLLGGGTLVFALAAWVRFSRHESGARTASAAEDVTPQAADPSSAAPSASAGRSPAGIPRYQLGMIALAVLLLVAALGVAGFGVAGQPHSGFAELWLLNDPPGAVRVGFSNHEGSDRVYRVEVAVNGELLRTFDSVTLTDGAQSETTIQLPADIGPAPSRAPRATPGVVDVVTAALFHEGESAPYRTVRVTVALP